MYRSNLRVAGLAGVAVTVLALTTVTSAHAQSYTMGGDARAFAMGGAGIALTQGRSSGGRANPASLAFETREVLPTFPSVGVRSEGPANANAASTYLMGGTKGADAMSLAAQFGTGRSDLGVNSFAALRMGKMEVSANAVGVAHILPNEKFASWAGTPDKNPLNLDSQGRADIYAAGYYTLPSVATGFTLPTKGKSANVIGVGVRVKQMNGLYSHRVVAREDVGFGDQTVSRLNTSLAPEMGGENQITKKGVGADLGFMIRPRNGAGFSAALVVANAVRPSFKFAEKDADGKTIREFDILQTSVSAGVGFETRTGLTLALDAVNIGGKKTAADSFAQGMSANGQQFRVGAEQRILKTFALRGGYSSQGGATYGVGFFGLDVAFGKRVPLEVVKTINF